MLRRWARAPAMHAASYFDHEKRVAWVFFFCACIWSCTYVYGALLSGPSSHRSSDIRLLVLLVWDLPVILSGAELKVALRRLSFFR